MIVFCWRVGNPVARAAFWPAEGRTSQKHRSSLRPLADPPRPGAPHDVCAAIMGSTQVGLTLLPAQGTTTAEPKGWGLMPSYRGGHAHPGQRLYGLSAHPVPALILFSTYPVQYLSCSVLGVSLSAQRSPDLHSPGQFPTDGVGFCAVGAKTPTRRKGWRRTLPLDGAATSEPRECFLPFLCTAS